MYYLIVNKDVYLHLLHTFGKRPGVWFGLSAEVASGLLLRVWLVIIMAQIAERVAAGDFDAAKQSIYLFACVYVVGALIKVAGDLVAIRAENRQYGKMIVNYQDKLTKKDMMFYRDHQTGYLVSLFRQYLDSYMGLTRLFRGEVVHVLIAMTVPTLIMFTVNRWLGAVAAMILIVQMVYVFWSSKKANKYRSLSHEIYRKVTGEVSDAVTNIVAFKSSGVERQAKRRLANLAKQETHTFWIRRKINLFFDLPRDLITAVGVAIAFLVAASSSDVQSQTAGVIVLTITYMFQIMRSVTNLPDLMTRHDDLVTKAQPTLSLLTSQNETIKEPSKPKPLNIKQGQLELDKVSFSYSTQSAKTKVFNKLSLKVKGGESVGIVGLSGAGKSTLASLIMRFDDINEGSIKIDGIDIRDVLQSELRQRIAYVPQEPLLFHRTIRENIAYFNDKATDQQVERAAKAAHAHDFISKLPLGYDSMVGERGVKLSGGQKQRVVIARAILKNAPILIFDEATSALDSESEKIIQNALPQIIGKHTAIIIAHRLSTVAGLDRILVMENGEIIEQGTHAQLLKLKGRYHALWQKQVKSHHA